MLNLTSFNDQKLYRLCKFYGEQAKKWRYKFMGLLPEVYKRKLYEKKGFSSIFEFAKKLAGLSEEQVRTILNLEKKFEDKPILKELLITGEVSVNKLVRVQSVATKENQEFWADQVRILPKNALETLVRDEKLAQLNNQKIETIASGFLGSESYENKQTSFQEFENKNDLNEPLFEEKSLPGQTKIASEKLDSQFQLSSKVNQKLLELEQKGIDGNMLILEMLKKRELEIAQEKEQLVKEIYKRTDNLNTQDSVEEIRMYAHRADEKAHPQTPVCQGKPSLKPSRYISVKIKNLLQKEHGTKCSIKACPKPAEHIHHTQRFALARVHDPRYLAPLCKNHHIVAHSIDQKFQQKRAAVIT